MSKFYIDQHGCAKNQVDGEIIVSKLLDDGFELVQNADDADYIIINSCGFIESAKKESLDSVYNARKLYSKKKIILAGCLAERYSEIFKENLPEPPFYGDNNDNPQGAVTWFKTENSKVMLEHIQPLISTAQVRFSIASIPIRSISLAS